MEEQPVPVKNNHEPTWEVIINSFEEDYNAQAGEKDWKHLLKSIMEDFQFRNIMGEKKYKTKLQPFNGRNSGQDTYEEALDGLVYARNKWIECAGSKALYCGEYEWRSTYYDFLDLVVQIKFMLTEEQKGKLNNG